MCLSHNPRLIFFCLIIQCHDIVHVHVHRSEFLKEKNRSKIIPGTSTRNSAIVGSSSSPGELASDHTLPQIKPYTRKRPHDSISKTVSALRSGLSSEAEADGGDREAATVDLESAAVSFEVKPYVRKRKIKHKQENH